MRNWSHETQQTLFPDIRERAVRMVFEHQSEYSSQWATIGSIAEKFGCTPETLRSWVRQAERDRGVRAGQTNGRRVSDAGRRGALTTDRSLGVSSTDISRIATAMRSAQPI